MEKQQLEQLVQRLEQVTLDLRAVLGGSQNAGSNIVSVSAEAPNTVKLYDDALNSFLNEFLQTSAQIGGDVNEIALLVKQTVETQRVFLWNTAGFKKPDDSALSALLKPMCDAIEKIQTLKNAKRTSQLFNHLSAIAEGVPAFGWVTVSPTPAPYIKEMIDASQFYTNRVLKDFKEKDKIHGDWTKSWVQMLTGLQQYVKANHTTGLVWNSSPGSKVGAAPAPAKPSASGGAPAPPPPPPAGFMLDDANSSKSDQLADSRAALFAEINKGENITKGLKKVPDDMKTHKNPDLRQPTPVSATTPKTTAAPPNVKQTVQKPPKKELEGGKKWVLEYLNNDNNIVVQVTDMKQVAYIYKCANCVIQFKGKINTITMDDCVKTSLVFDDLLSSVEIVNCKSLQIQSLGKMPTLVVQKTDGCQIYLSKESLNAEIVTSKSSEMNILVPNNSGEYDEFSVPEQYKTVWNGKKLATSVVDIA